ncbi:glycosyltransferase family 4 protein [Qipengyuania sediminis]|uniref:glycosyltransferase family 4 protein n=1 Tax=Qipengyuania sediminis TaxID=1532023 RepID=UPI0010595A50|nr:glycosyltransferase family 1 protein [Qipengyuania sediminis]
MNVSDLRVALVSGNYNMVRDGPTQALGRLVRHLLDEGAEVRVFCPTVEHPQVDQPGEIVSLPSFAIPGRGEYRIPLGLIGAAKRAFAAFGPNVVHVASPDRAARQAARWAREHGVPVLASVHTRFETYPQYYGVGFMEPVVEAWLRRLYRRCDALVAPSDGMVDVLRRQRMHDDIGIWSRGVDRSVFHAGARDLSLRRSLGITDGDVAIGFLGRVVMEKGLPEFADTLAELARRGVPHKVMVLGDGPARDWLAERVPEARFAGYQTSPALGHWVAGMDIFFNPSITETFGNVTLEAMACGVPVVAARATGSTTLVADGETGTLVSPGDIAGFADALQRYAEDAALRRAHGAAGEALSKTFDWDTINRQMAQTYLRLLEARRL